MDSIQFPEGIVVESEKQNFKSSGFINMGVTRRELIQGAALIGAVGIGGENQPVAAVVNEQVCSSQILLQIYFKVDPKRSAEFEEMFAESYVPALRKQQGYLRSGLLRLFAPDVAEEIQAEPTQFNYQMELVFDTEENRRKWVASKEHVKAWPHASGMAQEFAWRGFDVVGVDRSSE